MWARAVRTTSHSSAAAICAWMKATSSAREPHSRNPDVLLLQLEVPLDASLAAAAIVKARGGTVILDPAPAPKDGLSADVLKAVDIITPNETEAGLILGWQPQSLEEGLRAAKELRARGVATAVVKLGAKGLAVAAPWPRNHHPVLQGHAHRHGGRGRQFQRRPRPRAGTGKAARPGAALRRRLRRALHHEERRLGSRTHQGRG
jgi:NAD(P)H-hydrate repair Nnr-like enzyme with NAD(P)H-hydrate dehydratase domain